MKILLVSLPSIHAVRWSNQLIGQGWEIYWFDILSRGRGDFHPDVTQIINWKKNKILFKGKTFLKNNLPNFYTGLQGILEITIEEFLSNFLDQEGIQIVHSFEMQSCSYPLLSVLTERKHIKWIYSCWGSDLYFYRNIKSHLYQIEKCLSRIDALFTDCQRDKTIARELGFIGRFLGIFPGGGGYNLDNNTTDLSIKDRNSIIVKGYQNDFGRAVEVLKAFSLTQVSLTNFDLVIFSAGQDVMDVIPSICYNFKSVIVFRKDNTMSQQDILKIMGASFLYIGNSISDGIPNTLLEAMLMGVYPLQSNPGGVTEELVTDGINGRLICEPEDSEHIALLIDQIIESRDSLESAIIHNKRMMKHLERNKITKEVIEAYKRFI